MSRRRAAQRALIIIDNNDNDDDDDDDDDNNNNNNTNNNNTNNNDNDNNNTFQPTIRCPLRFLNTSYGNGSQTQVYPYAIANTLWGISYDENDLGNIQ